MLKGKKYRIIVLGKRTVSILICIAVIISLIQITTFAGVLPTKQILIATDGVYVLTESGDVYYGEKIDTQTPQLVKSNVKQIVSDKFYLMNNGDFDRGTVTKANAKEVISNDIEGISYITQNNQLVFHGSVLQGGEEKIVAENVVSANALSGMYFVLNQNGETLLYDRNNSIVKIADNVAENYSHDAISIQLFLSLTKNNDLYLLTAKHNQTSVPTRIATDVRKESVCINGESIYYISNNGDLYHYTHANGQSTHIGSGINVVTPKFAMGNDKNLYNISHGATKVTLSLTGIKNIIKYHFTRLADLVVDEDNNLYSLHWISYGGRYTLSDIIIDDIADVVQFGDSILCLKTNGEIWGANYSKANGRFEASFLTSYGQKPLRIMFNGTEIKLTLKVHNVDGRTMYPFRECLEAMGARVSWDAVTSTAIGELNGVKVEFPIGKNEYWVNGVKKEMDTVSYVDESIGRTYIPLRFAAEGLGFKVDWQDTSQAEIITISK